MKAFLIASISGLILAQDASTPKKPEPKIATTELQAGQGVNAKASSKAQATVIIDPSGDKGVLQIKQRVFFPPKSQTSPDNIVQSWIGLKGATEKGENVYGFASGRFSVTDPESPTPAAVNVAKVCGKADDMSLPGYTSVIRRLDTWSCYMNFISHQCTEANVTESAQAMIQEVQIGVTNDQNRKTVLRGATLEIMNGFNIYTNTATSAALIDSWDSGATTAVILESAPESLAQVSVSAAAIILASQLF